MSKKPREKVVKKNSISPDEYREIKTRMKSLNKFLRIRSEANEKNKTTNTKTDDQQKADLDGSE